MKKRKSIILAIPQPCSEDWDKMKLIGNTRQCLKCNKALTDFTQFTDSQLLDYVSSYNGTICGKFSNHQLNRELIHYNPENSSFLQKLLFGTILATSLVACNSHNPGNSGKEVSLHLSSGTEKVNTTPEKDTNYITGRVVDLDKNPMDSIKITIKWFGLYAYTDVKGFFKIYVPENINRDITLKLENNSGQSSEVKYTIDKLPFDKEITLQIKRINPTATVGVLVMPPKSHIDSNDVYYNPSTMPHFNDVSGYLSKNINYPDEAQKKGIHGTTYISFIVEKSGEVSTVKVVRGVDAMLDSEAVKVIRTMPKWVPGKQDKKPVRTRFTIPIRFILNADSAKGR